MASRTFAFGSPSFSLSFTRLFTTSFEGWGGHPSLQFFISVSPIFLRELICFSWKTHRQQNATNTRTKTTCQGSEYHEKEAVSKVTKAPDSGGEEEEIEVRVEKSAKYVNQKLQVQRSPHFCTFAQSSDVSGVFCRAKKTNLLCHTLNAYRH